MKCGFILPVVVFSRRGVTCTPQHSGCQERREVTGDSDDGRGSMPSRFGIGTGSHDLLLCQPASLVHRFSQAGVLYVSSSRESRIHGAD